LKEEADRADSYGDPFVWFWGGVLPNDWPTDPPVDSASKGRPSCLPILAPFRYGASYKARKPPGDGGLSRTAQEGRRDQAECLSEFFKLTTIDAMVMAGFEREVAKNQSMVNHFNRLLHKSKVKEVGDGEPPVPPVWPLLAQQLKSPPVPNPMPPPLPPVLGGPLFDSRPPLSSVKPPPKPWRHLPR
jgi:hypothetical protein